jgi:hypothetical protein
MMHAIIAVSSKARRLAPGHPKHSSEWHALPRTRFAVRSPVQRAGASGMWTTTLLSACSRAAVGDDCSALDHHVDARAVREERQIVQRIAIDQQQIERWLQWQDQ